MYKLIKAKEETFMRLNEQEKLQYISCILNVESEKADVIHAICSFVKKLQNVNNAG